MSINTFAIVMFADRVTAGLGFGQKKMSDPILGLDSYDQIRFKIGQNPDVLILKLFKKSR